MHKDASMRKDPKSANLPEIVVSALDKERLSNLATAAMGPMPELGEELMSEIERAEVGTGPALSNVVQMGSMIEYRLDDGQQRRVQLVFPRDADIAEGKVSILTPIGTALIGLSAGQSIIWTTRDGREQRLTVLSVDPAAEPE
jgi:regulator of nucleoside diphosphate kinase